jgi:hypothetical protein
MGTISSSPRPNGPIGYVRINGQSLPVEAAPVWWRYWTEQMDASRVLLPSTVTTTVIEQGAATDVISANVPAFTLNADSFTPDSEAMRDNVVSITYAADAACKVVVSVSALYEVSGASAVKVIITGGINISGQWSGFNDTIQESSILSAPDYNEKGYISTSQTFTVSAGETNTYAFLAKVFRPGSEVVELSNVYMRAEAIKV